MFEILTPQRARLINLFVLSQKNRAPEDNPGAKLLVEMTLPNDALSHFDGHLKGMLFTKHGKPSAQANLDGVPAVSDMPNLTPIGLKIGKMHWEHESTGYEFEVVQGLNSKRSNIAITDCVLSKWTIAPKEGGTVVARVYIESQDVSESAFGKLAKLKSREVDVMFRPPEVNQRDIEEERKASEKRNGNGLGEAPSSGSEGKAPAKPRRAPKPSSKAAAHPKH